MGYAEVLKLKYEDIKTIEGKSAEAIIRGVDRAANLTRQLLGFARKGKYDPKPINVNNLIKEAIHISEKIFEKKMDLKLDLNDKAYSIEADKNQMNQVITNIMINARDAMPKGGELLIKTDNTFLDEGFTYTHPEVRKGYYVMISLTDTGIGMTREVKNHIFEPFFTTKGEGKGTGLGLATVYGIVKNHYGHINCYSEPGIGTTFNIYLPATEKNILPEDKEEPLIRGNETVFVVDDEDDFRGSAEVSLKALGYKVFTAVDGEEAVKLYKDKYKEIDIVLLDMIMPKMAGRETYLELKKINPEILVVLSSGYSQDGTAAEILEEGVKGFIQKPYKMHELSKKISDTLKIK
jgi:CheY-like chemotaxis protein